MKAPKSLKVLCLTTAHSILIILGFIVPVSVAQRVHFSPTLSRGAHFFEPTPLCPDWGKYYKVQCLPAEPVVFEPIYVPSWGRGKWRCLIDVKIKCGEWGEGRVESVKIECDITKALPVSFVDEGAV